MSVFNYQTQNALKDVQSEIKKAKNNNDSTAVDFYHSLQQYIETHEILKFTREVNQPAMENIIKYFQEKMEYLMEKL